MTRYITKPIEIDAVQYTGNNKRTINEFVRDMLVEHKGEYAAKDLDIPLSLFVTKQNTVSTQAWNYVSEGKEWDSDIVAAVYDYLHDTWVGVKSGQYIICGMKGEFYPCDPGVFDAKYDQIVYAAEG